MTPTLLPDFTQSSLEWIRQTVEKQREPMSPETTRDVFFLCNVTADLLETFWQQIQTVLQRGTEGRQLSTLITRGIQVADNGLDVYARAKTRAGLNGREEFPKEGEDLGTAVARVQKVRANLQALRDWLDSPRPAVNLEALRAPTDSREGYESLDAVLARLRSGGDL